MGVIIKYTVFALLMVAAVMFSVHGMFGWGTCFILVSAFYAVVFLQRDDDGGDGFYKLT